MLPDSIAHRVLHLIDSGGLYGAERMLLSLVEQQIQPFPCGEFSLLVLLGDAGRPAALLGERLPVMQLLEKFSGVGHDRAI